MGHRQSTRELRSSTPVRSPLRVDRRIRVLIVNKYAHVTGGADRHCLALAGWLTDRGHDVAMLSTAGEENVVHAGVFIEGKVTHQTRAGLPAARKAEVLLRALWNPTAEQAMRTLIARFRPQVVHCHKLYPQLSVAPVVVARQATLPVIQTLHDYELLSASALDHTGGWVDTDETRFSYRCLNTVTLPVRRRAHAHGVSAFIACSRFVAERYRAGLGVEATVLPYFVEPSRRPPIGFADREGALFVGRLHEEKGVRDVIVLAERVPAIRVSVVGYGPLESAVVEAERRLPNLRFLGRRTQAELWPLLEHARVALMPSRWQEPGGIAALEAMSVGTPVVAYANGGLAEYVSDTGGGEVVRARPEDLVDAVRRLHDNEPVWLDRSSRAVSGVSQLHSPTSYLARVEALYQSVAGRD